MESLGKFVRRLLLEESGQDMIEYVLLFALVSIVAVAALITAGKAIDGFWTSAASVLGGISI